jgi:hypothetical protein
VLHEYFMKLLYILFIDQVEANFVGYQETLEYASAINICYRRQSLKLQARVPSGLTWATARIVTETLNPVVEQCIMNQRRWLLSEALVSAMIIYIKLIAVHNRREFANPPLISRNQDSELMNCIAAWLKLH